MKQLVVNQLEGGFVVQTVVDGKQETQMVAVNYGQVIKAGRKFFEGLEILNDQEPPSQPEHVFIGEFPHEVDQDTPDEDSPQEAPRRRGRPRKSINDVS